MIGAMIYIRKADFDDDLADIRKLRFAVFVIEQGVPENIEIDDRDPACVHVLAFDGEEPVGTGRIDLEKQGKVGRVAVIATRRRCGIGEALMQELHNIAEQSGLGNTWCHVQTSAIEFYRRLGYETVGDRFMEADIEHVRMEKAFDF